MRVWLDVANSPHVPLFEPVVERLRRDGHHLCLTARDHAQTVALAHRNWPETVVVGGRSPPGRAAKGFGIARRAAALRRFAARVRPDVALSHGSYAQVVAARTAGIPAVTMMDYEHQPANHLSFRLAQRVLVPELFPEEALRRFGARGAKVVRYPGFKEDLYLAGFRPDPAVLAELGLDRTRIIAVFRPPPDGALYHRVVNERFHELLNRAVERADVQAVVLPRERAQAHRYAGPEVTIPATPVDGRSLLAYADVLVGAGGTMNREAALLGTPAYTVFAGRLAGVDAELIRLGLLHDLRDDDGPLRLAPKEAGRPPVASSERRDSTFCMLLEALEAAVTSGRG